MIYFTAKVVSGETVFVEATQAQLYDPEAVVDVVFDSQGPGPIVIEQRKIADLSDFTGA
jgi:hypothetical protein